MISETLKNANAAMMASVTFANDKAAAERYKKQIMQLSPLSAQLEQLLSVIETMKSEKIGETILGTEMRDTLQNAVDSCGQKTDDRTLDEATVNALKIATDSLKVFIENIWKIETAKEASDVVNSLKSLSSLMSNEDEVDQLIEDIENASSKLPKSEKNIKDFKTNISKAKKMVDDLHLIPEAEAFVAKVRLQKATVADLYDEKVLNWIRDNHLEKQLKIRF